MKPPERPGSGLVLEDKNFEDAIRHIADCGVHLDLGPFEGPACSIAVISDPDRNQIGLRKRKN